MQKPSFFCPSAQIQLEDSRLDYATTADEVRYVSAQTAI